MVLAPELSSTRLSRRFVEDHWCHVHDGADLRAVHLLVTELVSNAVRYGGPPIALTLDCVGAEGVKLSVSDGSEEDPVARDVGPEGEGGRGVRLVDLLSVEWGVLHPREGSAGEPVDGAGRPGKTVWCRLVA